MPKRRTHHSPVASRKIERMLIQVLIALSEVFKKGLGSNCSKNQFPLQCNVTEIVSSTREHFADAWKCSKNKCNRCM